jgi:hypothetical protein
MNEEQQVLAFFAARENLPLALIAAEHLDGIRRDLNNEFWQVMQSELDALLNAHALPWTSKLAEDRNTDDCLVGLYLEPQEASRVFLRPFMEQQYIGDGYRVYHGLMWNAAPDAAQKALPALGDLSVSMQAAGFKQGDNFFGWQWLAWHPRRRDFLMRFSQHRDEFIPDMMQPWRQLLLAWGEQLQQANRALADAATSTTVSLDQLRSTLPSQGA